MRRALLLLWTPALLAMLGWLVWQKENTLAHGRLVLLELVPVDPRSLMQGDYMILRYKLTGTVPEKLLHDGAKGRLVLKLDPDGVATYARMDEGGPLALDETLLTYRMRDGLRLGAEAFFFQEGHARYYARARYGELRVAPHGEAVLTGLRDHDRQPLDAPVSEDPPPAAPPGRPGSAPPPQAPAPAPPADPDR